MCQSSCDNPRSSFMEWSRTHNQALSLVPNHFKAILPIPRNHQNHPSDSLDWAPALKGMPIIKDLFVHLYVCWMEVYHIGFGAHMIQKEVLDPLSCVLVHHSFLLGPPGSSSCVAASGWA